MIERMRVIVTGRVQGVFFRESTRRKALSLGLSGWVLNLPDGRVEWVAEGEKNDLEVLLRWCQAGGPPWARVDGIEVLASPETPVDPGFRVIR
jgi:acylphosphatase